MDSVVLAKWRNATRKYPAIVKNIKSKSLIDIEFYDGVELETRTSAIQKLPADLQDEVI